MTQLLPRYRARAANGSSVAIKIVRERRCRMCERPWHVRPPTRHHLVPLAARGRVSQRINDPRNIIPICRPCHDLIDHRNPLRRSARVMLRKLLHAEEAQFASAWMGSGWLNHTYPRG